MITQNLIPQKKVLFTDGEGPLVFKDLAQDLMGRITFKLGEKEIKGADFFELLSLYDDYLAEVGTKGYQAGDTLALVVPHFLHHGLTDEDVANEAKDVKLCLGVKEYIDGLKKDGVEIRIISTAYRPMWKLVGDYLGIPQEQIACTELDLRDLRDKYQTFQLYANVEKMEQDALPLLPWVAEMKEEIDSGKSVIEVFQDAKYASLVQRLDEFYWQELKELNYEVLRDVEVVGGKRKIEAAKRFADELSIPMSWVAYVGDSITDDQMHKFLSNEGGLPVAVNGNAYAIRNTRVAVATTDMRNIRPILNAWTNNGIEGVRSLVEVSSAGRLVGSKEGQSVSEKEGFYYDMVEGASAEQMKDILTRHKVFRKLVRGPAAKLG